MTVSWKTTTPKSEAGAIASAKALFDVTTINTAATITLTADQFVNGFLFQSAGACTITTPTATLIVAAIRDCAIGSHFFFGCVAGSANALTLTAGAGVTIPAAADVVTAGCAGFFIGVVSAVGTPAVYLSHVLAT